ncbi:MULTISPECIES: aminotransferase class V-fold PLP-dependent enzyme [Clostridium]|uniref:Selenocysteine lyase/cysteine desulfurase n=2 Tax=Clostridium beijerinckii TaxID=1520 RepID=A0A9Q5CKL9_CLOBE|nr:MULTISPECIES: aminotransferase class V-fold PLP-dependent enzyme [Clostridium]AQS03204.1 cysteine desulfurase SufS [Clostridium beijerinckii]MBA2886659.1 selenocysteine lyase/cysteine desulfurase [Clostridium beijerinckii]MBA2901252.1 selenocysteine lyase/cysteine desulfurase [Clostridium beijerinckii]MBA2911219.1 selenocysteine lyase/cysteine desulfurase [Clostridium beijerinckii]MBA9017261.1 selenocysteine lyase/cysteine desulfurase [Clostridium beijerinckii]
MKIENKENIKDLFVGLDEKVCDSDGNCIDGINFDNAATTPPIKSSIEYIKQLSNTYASIGRGTGQKAEITTNLYKESKNFLLDFFNVKDKDKYVVIYVSNTTEGINKLAKTLTKTPDEIVLTSRMEHHSNDLPWRKRGNVDYIEVDQQGRLKLEELEEKLKKSNGKIKYVSLTGASNVTGYINHIHFIAKLVHKYGAKLIVDGAQLVPHTRVNISGDTDDDQIDFLVFSSHKIYSPFGIGVIIGLKEDFMDADPDYLGGGTVELVMDREVKFLTPPEKNEAGTPNFLGVMSLVNSLRVINTIGYDYIEKHERLLLEHTIEGLKKIPKIMNYGDTENISDRLGIATFNIEDMYHHDVADILAKKKGISVRHGWFCSHPYCRRLMNVSEDEAKEFLDNPDKKMLGMIRVSFALYNSIEEVDTFLNVLEDISLRKIK